jgi:hypothetical protein
MFPFMISPSGVEESFANMTDATHLHPFFSRRYQLASRSVGEGSESSSVPERAAAEPAAAAS